jgi:hypothetical protein
MTLFKALSSASYSKQDILELFRFMDWVLAFALHLSAFTTEYEEAKKMPYVTSIERLGALEQSQEDVVEVLRVRFKDVHESLVKAIHTIYDQSFLSQLLREAILVNSLDAFEKLVKKPDND